MRPQVKIVSPVKNTYVIGFRHLANQVPDFVRVSARRFSFTPVSDEDGAENALVKVDGVTLALLGAVVSMYNETTGEDLLNPEE